MLWVLCDYCEMLVFLSEIMGVLDYKFCNWLLNRSYWFFMMILCEKW
jgi:hypothetical protein